MELNKKQREAVEYLEGPLLVLAGPGTGKTQLLSEKVAYILRNIDVGPENILCLTFTESGAFNMRERLKTIIGQDGMKVNIGTYHSFGSEILGQYKNYTENYDRRLDAAIDEVTQFKIVKTIQDNLSGNDILRGDSVKDIISVISSAKSAGLSAHDLKKIADVNIEDSDVLSHSISPLLKNIVPRVFEASYKNAYLPIYEILKDYTDSKPILGKIDRLIVGLARDLKTAIIEAESTKKIKPLSAWKDTYFEKNERGEYRLRDRIANKKLLSIANVMKLYDEYLNENGLYDFDDMIEEAVRVLKTDPGFKATLSERYQFILLDEFQDTNPSQFNIIKELTNYEKPMIMAVGDDDQAIYEFQGALSTNLTDFQKHYSANVIPLIENYRSTQEILDFSRNIINQANDRFADKELTAHRNNPPKSMIYRHEFLSSDMEYGFIADEISKLIKKGIPQSEIAIISYKTKYFMPLLPYLKAKPEINISYEKRDNLFEDEKMHEIITLSKFIFDTANNRRPSVSILEILSFSFFNLPMVEIIKLINKAKLEKRAIFDLLSESENERIYNVTKFLADLIAKSYNEPLEVFLDYLIGASELNGFRSPFLKYHTSQNEFATFSLYENLAALRGKLRQHFGEKSLKLSDLATMVEDYETAEMGLNTTSPYKDADEAVSVLTAHKAKGLEFSYVFIISADHVAWGKGKGNNNLLTLPKNLMQIRHTGTTDGEKLRILYVALTRAKDSIYITNSLKDFNGKSPNRLEYLEEYNEGNNVISPFLPNKKVITHYNLTSYESAENNLRNWLSSYAVTTPDMQAIYRDKVSRFRLSASSLTSFIDIVYSGPQEFFKNYILGAPREPETEALAYGDLVHKTFEFITNKKASKEDAIDYYIAELNKKELPSDLLKKLREKGINDISIAITAFENILRNGKAEVNFSSEKLSINGVPVTGKIDHILVDEANKIIEIYDFKTGGYHKEKWRSHATLYKYMLQLGFYKLLLNNSSIYSKYKIEKAHILFVSPDKDGEVYDKIYEFNSQDENELKSLIRAVYNQISSLAFMKNSKIFVPPNQSLGLKDIKSFIELLLA